MAEAQGRTGVRRSRVSSETRRLIVDAVIHGNFNGAQAARAYSVSEATVHRLLKAARLSDPEMASLARPSAVSSDKNISAINSSSLIGDTQGRRALTSAQQDEVIELFYSGSSLATDLARRFGVHKSTISRILREAKAKLPSRAIPELNSSEWQRRVNAGVLEAIAAGRHPGARQALPIEIQQLIIVDSEKPGETFASIGRRYSVSASRVGRLVNSRRIRHGPNTPPSLIDIFSEMLKT